MAPDARSPSEYFIKFLLSNNIEELDDRGVREAVRQHGLDPGSRAYRRHLKETELEPYPPGYSPLDTKHKASVSFLKSHRIYDMWHGGPGVKEATLILQDYVLRERLEPLLLSPTPIHEVIRSVQQFTSVKLTMKGVLAYRHFFWNREVMTQEQWIDYLNDGPRGHVKQAGLVLAPDVMNTHLAHAVGLAGPPAWQGADSIVRVAQIAFGKALQLEHLPANLENARTLKTYFDILFRTDEVTQRSGSALRDVLRVFQQFRMHTEDSKAKSIEEIAGRNFSGSGEGTGEKKTDF